MELPQPYDPVVEVLPLHVSPAGLAVVHGWGGNTILGSVFPPNLPSPSNTGTTMPPPSPSPTSFPPAAPFPPPTSTACCLLTLPISTPPPLFSSLPPISLYILHPFLFQVVVVLSVVVLHLLSVTGVHLLLGVVTAPLLRIHLFLLRIPLLFLLGIPLLFLLGIPLRFLVLLFVGRHHLLIGLILVTIRASSSAAICTGWTGGSGHTVIIAIVPYCTTVPLAILSINPVLHIIVTMSATIYPGTPCAMTFVYLLASSNRL
ncbi:unnamed protein product [Closterium sp. NIES-53]